MKRVLHVIDHLGLGGAQAVLFDLVTLSNPHEWDIEVATLHGWGLFADALEEKKIKVHSLAPSVWPPVYVPAFLKLQSQFDLFHFHLSGANWITKPLAALVGNRPCIVHDHASDNLQFRGVSSIIMDVLTYGFSTHTIAVSPDIKKFLLHYEGLAPSEVTTIPNGVNTTLFQPPTLLEKNEARRFFGLNEKDYIIGNIGRLVAAKNQKLFLQAAKKICEQRSDAIFVIAGTGPEEGPLRLMAEEFGIAEQVKFLGQVEERALFYQALDRFVLTSLYEGLPIVLLEAMASGIPVVSTDLEGIRFVLEEGKHGVLVPSGNVEALVTALAQQPDRHQILTARAKVESDFSAVGAAEKVTQLYTSCLENV